MDRPGYRNEDDARGYRPDYQARGGGSGQGGYEDRGEGGGRQQYGGGRGGGGGGGGRGRGGYGGRGQGVPLLPPEQKHLGSVTHIKDTFGFIQSGECGRVFFHFSESLSTPPLQPGDTVLFGIKEEPRTGKTCAIQVVRVSAEEMRAVDLEPHRIIGNVVAAPRRARRDADTATGRVQVQFVGADGQEGTEILSFAANDMAEGSAIVYAGDIVELSVGVERVSRRRRACSVAFLESTLPKLRGETATLKDSFGFISTPESAEKYFFHFSELPPELRADGALHLGQEFEFHVIEGEAQRPGGQAGGAAGGRGGGGGAGAGGGQVARCAVRLKALPRGTVEWTQPVPGLFFGEVQHVAADRRRGALLGKVVCTGRVAQQAVDAAIAAAPPADADADADERASAHGARAIAALAASVPDASAVPLASASSGAAAAIGEAGGAGGEAAAPAHGEGAAELDFAGQVLSFEQRAAVEVAVEAVASTAAGVSDVRVGDAAAAASASPAAEAGGEAGGAAARLVAGSRALFLLVRERPTGALRAVCVRALAEPAAPREDGVVEQLGEAGGVVECAGRAARALFFPQAFMAAPPAAAQGQARQALAVGSEVRFCVRPSALAAAHKGLGGAKLLAYDLELLPAGSLQLETVEQATVSGVLRKLPAKGGKAPGVIAYGPGLEKAIQARADAAAAAAAEPSAAKPRADATKTRADLRSWRVREPEPTAAAPAGAPAAPAGEAGGGAALAAADAAGALAAAAQPPAEAPPAEAQAPVAAEAAPSAGAEAAPGAAASAGAASKGDKERADKGANKSQEKEEEGVLTVPFRASDMPDLAKAQPGDEVTFTLVRVHKTGKLGARSVQLKRYSGWVDSIKGTYGRRRALHARAVTLRLMSGGSGTRGTRQVARGRAVRL